MKNISFSFDFYELKICHTALSTQVDEIYRSLKTTTIYSPCLKLNLNLKNYFWNRANFTVSLLWFYIRQEMYIYKQNN